MTDKITLELTLDELKELDKNLYYCEETWGICDKIRNAYPQPKMTFSQSGEFTIVSYNYKLYCRFEYPNGDNFSWYKTQDVPDGYVTGVFEPVTDAETEKLLEGLYYNHIVVKKEKEQQTKSPVEEAYKRWMDNYPPTGPSVDGIDDIRWRAFQMGYNASKEEKVKMSESLHAGYYLAQKEKAQERGERLHKDVERCVRESVKWCEDHPNENPLDYLTPKSPEETEQSLKEAFREAQQTEKWKEIQKLIDEEDNDKNFKNSLDLIKEWGEKNKPITLKELLWEWWEDIFTVDSDLNADASIDVLVDRIEEFLPKEHCTNSYKWNQCIRTIKEKLR